MIERHDTPAVDGSVLLALSSITRVPLRPRLPIKRPGGALLVSKSVDLQVPCVLPSPLGPANNQKGRSPTPYQPGVSFRSFLSILIP